MFQRPSFIAAVTLIVTCLIAASISAQSTPPDKTSPEITSLNLDKSEVSLPCEPGRHSPLPQCGGDMTVDVSTATSDNTKTANIRYKVSGGKIIGEGPNVKWDLTGVAKGTYTITADTDGGPGVTKSVAIVDCPDCGCGFVDCATIDIAGPADPDSSGRLRFTASVSGGGQDTLEYKWTVTNGEIVDGQGTPSVLVKFSRKAPESITLSLDFNDEKANEFCPRTVTKTVYSNPTATKAAHSKP